MASLIKYRVHEVAKDFNTTSKEITEILTEYATTPKNHMQVLEDEELAIIFDYLTQHNQIGSIAEVFNDTAPAPAPAAAKKEEPAKNAAAPKQPAPAPAAAPAAAHAQKAEKPDKPHTPRQVPEKRVIDTRSSSAANLSKYDERFDNMAGEKAQKMNRGKQKIGGRNKQRQPSAAACAKRRQEERD